MFNRLFLLSVLIPVITIIAKAVVVEPTIFAEAPISDEVYYVKVAGVILYKFGVLDEVPIMPVDIVPAYFSFIENESSYDVSISVPSNMQAIQLVFLPSPPPNEFPPITIRPILPSAVYTIKWLLGSFFYGRLVVLGLSLASITLFCYVLTRKYGVIAPLTIAVVYLVDGVSFRFSYMMMLDSLMLSFLILSLSFLAMNRPTLSLIFLSLSVASKEYAVVFAIAYVMYWWFGRKDIKRSITFFIVPVISVGASYLANMILVPLDKVIEGMLVHATVYDFTCQELCLTGIYNEWGAFRLFTLFVWMWFIAIFIRYRHSSSEDDVLSVAYLISLLNIVSVLAISFIRSVYNFYYATAVSLSAIALLDIINFIRIRFHGVSSKSCLRFLFAGI